MPGTAQKFRIVVRSKRVRLINSHCIRGNLFEITYRERVKARPTPAAPVGDPDGPILNLDFEPYAICERGGRVVGVTKLSETRWHFLKAVAVGEEVDFGAIILAVPEWDVEETDDGRVKVEATRLGDDLKNARIPFHIRTFTVSENAQKTQVAILKKGFKPPKGPQLVDVQ